MRAPRPLVPGARVAVIAPGSAVVDRAALRSGLARLRRFGLEPIAGRHLLARRGDLAGTDEQRAEDLAWALRSPDVDAVWAARGGWGTLRTLERLGPLELPAEPRWVVGFSDLTPLLGRLVSRGWPAIHGPVVCDLARPKRFVARDLAHWLFEGGRSQELDSPGIRSLVPGRARGRLAGGCLSLLAASCGTPYQPEFEGAVVLIEEVGEPPYRVDRMLWQLRSSGLLAGARGLVFGQMYRCRPPSGRASRSLREILSSHAEALGVPAVLGVQVGHGPRTRSVPFGAAADLDARRGRLVLRLPGPGRA